MSDTLYQILKDCPNKTEIIGSIEKLSHLNEFSSALRKYFSDRVGEKQKLTTLYQQCMQDKFKLEGDCGRMKNGLAEKEKIVDQQTHRIETLTKDLSETTNKVETQKVEFEQKYQRKQTTLQQEFDSLKGTNNLLIGEKNELLGIINRKDMHIQQLDEQWKENVDKLRKANATKCELQAKLDEYTQNGTLNEWKKKLVTQQSEIYENTIQQHLETISSQSNQLIKLSKVNNELKVNIESMEDQKTTEVNHLNDTIGTLRKHLENMQDNYKKLIEKAAHNESLMTVEKLELEKEINSSSRLSELLTDEKNDLTNTIGRHREIQNELIVKVNQLEKDNSNLVCSFNENSKLWNDNVVLYENKIKSLEDELTVAQTIVESSRVDDTSPLLVDNSIVVNTEIGMAPPPIIRRLSYNNNNNNNNSDSTAINKLLSPMAQSTSQLLKKGLTITQIYTNYNKAQNTIQQLKDDISKLSLQLEYATKQFEATKSDYELLTEEKNRSELYADHLSRNLIEVNTTVSEMDVRMSTLEDANANLLEQKLSLTQLTQDLSSQIRHLLHHTSTINDDSHHHSNNSNMADNNNSFDFDELLLQNNNNNNLTINHQVDTIVESSLEFKTVEQLQNQNMKLLALCRSLKQKTELLSSDPKTVEEYEKRLAGATDRIGELSEQLDTINRSYETTKKQLDIFMVVNGKNTSTTTNVGNISEKENSTATVAAADINNSAHSFEAIREQYNQMIASKMELLNEARLEVSRLNDHSNYLQSRITQLETQLTQLDEQRSHTIATLEHEKKEYGLKAEKFVQVDLLNRQLKENVSFYKSNYDEVSEKVNHLEQAHRALSDENSHLRETSKFLESQLQSQNSHSNNFGQLLSGIQDIQNSLEYRANSSGIKMMNIVDEMKEEIKTLRFQLVEAQENNDVRYHTDLQHLRLELKSKEDSISKLLDSESELRNKLNNAKEMIIPVSTTNSNHPLDTTTTSRQLVVDEQLGEYKKQIDQLLVVSAAAEENLEKNVNVWNECKQNLQHEISQLNSMVTERNAQIEQYNAQLIGLQNDLKDQQAIISQNENQQYVKVEPLLKEIEALKQREQRWNETKDQLNVMLKQLREKYEIELIGHADDITTLKENTKKYEDMAQKSHQYDHEIRTLKHKLESLQGEYNVKLEHCETANNDRVLQQKSIMEQNNILSNHVDSLMKQITAMKDKDPSNNAMSTIMMTSSSLLNVDVAVAAAGGGDQQTITNGSIEELWELIKYLRRDKDILETRLESQKSESFKYRIKCERLEKGCQSLEASLVAERSMLNDSSIVIDQTMRVNDLELLNGQLNQQVADLEAKCIGVEEKLQSVKCDGENSLKELSNKSTQFEVVSRELTSLKRQLAYTDNMCNNLKSQLANVNKNNADLNTKLAHLQTTRDSNEKTKVEMFNDRIRNLSNEIANCKNKINELSASRLKIVAEKDEIITSLNREHTALNDKINSLENNLRRSISRNESLHVIATHLKNEINNTKSAVANAAVVVDPIATGSNSDVDTTSSKQPFIGSQDYVQMEEEKQKNALLAEEVKRLKQKLNETHIPTDNYNKLNSTHEALKKKFDILSKHVGEMNKKQDSSNKVTTSHAVHNSDIAASLKAPPTLFGSIPIPIPIHRRISDGPASTTTTTTTTSMIPSTSSEGDTPLLLQQQQQQHKQTIHRISPPSKPPSSEGKSNMQPPMAAIQPTEVVATTLIKPSIFENVVVDDDDDDVLLSTDEGEFYQMTNNNSSTPTPATTNSSDLPSIFSDIKPPDDNDYTMDNVPPSLSNASAPNVDVTTMHIKKTPITHPSPSTNSTPNRTMLKRILVRHKTPILTPVSYNLRSSVGGDKEVASLQHNNLNQTDAQQSSLIEPSSVNDSSHDDSHFKKPQKRSMVSHSDDISHHHHTGDIVIDDSDEFEAKKSNINHISALGDDDGTSSPTNFCEANSSAVRELSTPSALFDTPIKVTQPQESPVVIHSDTNSNGDNTLASTFGGTVVPPQQTDTSSRSLKLRRSAFTLESQMSDTTSDNTKINTPPPVVEEKSSSVECEDDTTEATTSTYISNSAEKPKDDASQHHNEEET